MNPVQIMRVPCVDDPAQPRTRRTPHITAGHATRYAAAEIAAATRATRVGSTEPNTPVLVWAYDNEPTTRREFHLEHRSRLFWFSFDSVKFDKLCRERAKRKEDPDEELDADAADKIRRARCSVEESPTAIPMRSTSRAMK